LNVAAAARNSGIRTQEDSEKEAAARSTGGADSVKLSLDLKTISSTFSKVDMATFMHPGPVPTADTTFHFDSVTGDLFETGPNLVSTRFESGLNVDPQASDGGAALLTSLVDGSQSLIRLETTTPLASVVKNTFLSLDLQKPSEGLRVIGKVQGPSDQVPTLSGLGAIRDRLYASGTLNDRSGIYRVDLATNSFTPVMSPGIRLEGALAGSSERGSLFVFGHEPGTETAGGSPFSHGVILELDPRTNYLVAAYSANNGAFSQVPGTINPSRIDLEHTQAITGMSYVNGMIIMSAAVGSTGTGQTVLVEYNPAAANSPGHPAIERIMPAPEAFTTGLASETTARPPPSVPLANPPGRIDTLTINALFAQRA
jgi:hypothetical protein